MTLTEVTPSAISMVPEAGGMCHEATESLVVAAGPDQVVPTGQLVTADGYQIYNNRSFDSYVVPEATKSRSFTVVGPVLPP